ncbi:MAG: DNA repair exonuclease, partial [Methanobacteriaceae archaeon]|nr:DNA repair exonuclease [Methanobacteriaceae archaeon]
GLLERELDFYDVFDKCVDKIIEEECDFVIHSGDLFEFSKPSPNALLRFQKAFLRLKEADIPVYAIAGNHDSVRRKGAIPPQVLFKDLGLHLLSPNHPIDNYHGVLICGMPYVPRSNKDTLLEKFKIFSEEAEKSVVSILVAHQGIDKYLPFDYELEIGELPENFDYYAMGHVHTYINDAYGKGRLVYPGSSEIWKVNELGDYLKKGKGFAIVEIGVGEPIVRRVTVDLPRKIINEYIKYDDLDKKLALIKRVIMNLENKPIVNITIGDGEFSSSELNERIMNELGEYSLRIRLRFEPNKTKDEELITNESIGARASLAEVLQNKYNNEDITNFGLDLLDTLSKNDFETANLISDNFYSNHFESKDYIELKNVSNIENLKEGQGNIINRTSPEVHEKLAKNSLNSFKNLEAENDETEIMDDIESEDSIDDKSKERNKGQMSLFDSMGGN